jgi:hypothetical protein
MIDELLEFFQRNWVLSILVLMVFGYLLGLAITSTVDQRLRDAVIQMPTPKQTIIVNMNSKKTNEFFEGGSSSTDSSKASSSKKQEMKSDDESNSFLKKALLEDQPVYENFIDSKNRLLDNTNDEFISASAYAPSSYKDIPDMTQKAYALSYRLADSLSKVPFPFKAYNFDEAQQQFTKFTKNSTKK